MAKPVFYIDGTQIKEPFNYKELSLELNFDKDATQQVSVNTWEFVTENSKLLNNIVQHGLTGGTGIFEGRQFLVEAQSRGKVEKVFDGYLDLSQDENKYGCERTNITAKERLSIDWLNDIADSFTFERLYSQTGHLNQNDNIFIPYVISEIPNYRDTAIATIGVFVVSAELSRAIIDLTNFLIETANPFEATAIARLSTYIIYLSATLLALIKLIIDLVKLLIQPVKYHAGMTAKRQIEAACTYLGLKFSSPIISNGDFANMVLIPTKQFNPPDKKDSQLRGFVKPNKNEQEGFFKGTFGDLLRGLKLMFNAKILISGSTFYFVRKDKSIGQSIYTLPPVDIEQWSYNTSDLSSNFLISFQTDIQDLNTIDQYRGTSVQIFTEPISFTNKDLVSIKGLNQIDIPFALAKRKEDLTTPEKVFKVFLVVASAIINTIVTIINAAIKVLNKVIKQINKIIKALKTIGININFSIPSIPSLQRVDFGKIIENRKGMMLLSTDFIGVTKAVMINISSQSENNKININNSTLLSAKYLWDNFHYIDGFVPKADRPTANQKRLVELNDIPFCFKDYELVKNNNIIMMNDGKQAEIIDLKWNIWEETANIKIAIKELYTTNLKESVYEPKG